MEEDDVIRSLMSFVIEAKASGYVMTKENNDAIKRSRNALQKIIRLKQTVEGNIDDLSLDEAIDLLHEIKNELAV
jgi:hypothetical protein